MKDRKVEVEGPRKIGQRDKAERQEETSSVPTGRLQAGKLQISHLFPKCLRAWGPGNKDTEMRGWRAVIAREWVMAFHPMAHAHVASSSPGAHSQTGYQTLECPNAPANTMFSAFSQGTYRSAGHSLLMGRAMGEKLHPKGCSR